MALCVATNTNYLESPDAINVKEALNIELLGIFTGDTGFQAHETRNIFCSLKVLEEIPL